jgi:uncharacterized phage-associated protein
MIRFEFKPEKMASAIAYMALQRPGLTKKQISKLLYFADKEHLLQFGRTITGDYYKALPQGHVPRNGLNMINSTSEWAPDSAIASLARYGHLAPDKRTFVLENAPDMKVFSRSDVKVLDHVLETMGHLTAWQLERKSHLEPSWRKTPQKQRVPFELFFEGHPEAEPIKEALIEEQEVLA